MIHFYGNLKDLALDLIELKSNIDDVKANHDLKELSYVVAMAQPTKDYVETAKNLHEKVNREYPEIKEMCDFALTMQKNRVYNGIKRKTELENIVDCLITDEFGILASVLIKHNKIETIKEFIKEVD